MLVGPKLIKIGLRSILDILTNGLATTFARHEPNRAFMRCRGEVVSHTISYTYKYHGAVDSYQDYVAQILTGDFFLKNLRKRQGEMSSDKYLQALKEKKIEISTQIKILLDSPK